jgi:diacylglycerol O-acyltransferase
VDDRRRRAHLIGFVRREFAREHGRSPFDGRIGRRREIAFAVVSLDGLRRAAHALAGATVNDAILSVVAGAVGHWLERRHGSPGDLRVRVPVSLHHEGDVVANRDSFFSLALPVHDHDAVRRLRDVHRATAARKASGDAERMDSLLHGDGPAPPRLQRFISELEDSPRRFAVSVSNVPGPTRPVSVSGAAVRTVHSLAEVGQRHALRIAAQSLAGTLCLGFCADPDVVAEIDVMATAVETEAETLQAAAGG